MKKWTVRTAPATANSVYLKGFVPHAKSHLFSNGENVSLVQRELSSTPSLKSAPPVPQTASNAKIKTPAKNVKIKAFSTEFRKYVFARSNITCKPTSAKHAR